MKLTEEQIARVKSLEDEQGRLTASAVLADARKLDSPLNTLFDWDAAKAAEAHWLDCAREIVRTVKIVITTTETTIKAPYYVHDPDAKGEGYQAVPFLQRDEAASREAVTQELNRAAGSVTRARNLATALNMADEFDVLLDRLLGLQRRILDDAPAEEVRPS